MKFLLLEDNYHFAQMILDYCISVGFHLVHTDSVTRSKRLMDQEHFDLIIVDLHLQSTTGESGSGLDLITYVRHRKKSDLPIVVTTGLEIIDLSEIEGYGVDLVLNKPLNISLDEFFVKLQNLVRSR